MTLTYEQACLLLDRAGHRRERAMESYVDVALSQIGDRAVAQDMRRRNIWDDRVFGNKAARWLDYNQATIDSNDAASLDGHIGSLPGIPVHSKSYHKSAAAFRRRGLEHIANFLGQPQVVGTVHAAALDALCRGDSTKKTWAEMARLSGSARADEPHPLAVLADALAQIDPVRRQRLHANGYKTFVEVLTTTPDLMNLPDAYKEPLPAFLVLFRTHPDITLFHVAWRILQLRVRSWHYAHEERWVRALVRGVANATRPSGTRDAGDQSRPALDRLLKVVEVVPTMPAELRGFLFECVNPLRRPVQ